MLKGSLAKFWAKSVKQYRVFVYDQESLSQSRNFLYKPLTIAAVIGGASLLLIACTTALIFYVPSIHKQIPGFKDPVELQERYAFLNEKNLVLEREVEKLDTTLASLIRIAGMNKPTASDQKMWTSVTSAPESGTDLDSSQKYYQTADRIENIPDRERPIVTDEYKFSSKFVNLIPPLDGIVTNEFDLDEKSHFGIDIVADENSLIKSVADGVVIFSEYSITTGHVIGIWHARESLISFYKHNKKVYRQVGDFIFAGEAVAVIGNTGINSFGTHLHFELWHDNNPVNPADYIMFN